MQKKLVYDWPTRIFHWGFAGCFLVAFGVGKTVDDESALFGIHMIAGLMMMILVILRVIWGILGTKYARFGDFPLAKESLKDYFQGIFTGSKKKWFGHNPASSWAAILMMIMATLMVFTGINMATGGPEEIEEVHEFIAHLFLILVLGHLAGLALHTFRHKELIGLSMLDGRKASEVDKPGIPTAMPLAGLFMLIVLIVTFSFLYSGWDQNQRQINLGGFILTVGEAESVDADSD